MLGGSGTIRHVSADDSVFFCYGVSEGIPLCVLMCIDWVALVSTAF